MIPRKLRYALSETLLVSKQYLMKGISLPKGE